MQQCKFSSIGKKQRKLLFLMFSIPLIIFQANCKKLVEVNAPDTSTTSENVYTSDATAVSVLTGLYIRMSKDPLVSTNLTAISLKTGLSADELTLFGGATNSNTNLVRFYTNSLIDQTNETFWETSYNYLETINVALEKLTISTVLTPDINQQLIGEAKFMRAFCYFYLVNFYGDVPLIITSDYRVNAVSSRTSKTQVYQQIISDLKDAQNLLSTDYVSADFVTSTSERVRPNKWAATALLARVYLYTEDYVNAEAQATTIINNTGLYSLNTIKNAFKMNNSEAIWQLQPVNSGWNTEDARIFILPAGGPNNNNPVYLSDSLMNAFEVDDQRKVNWTSNVMPLPGTDTYYYSYKYKSATSGAPLTEYNMVLRLAEQYLIRAEARAQQNNVSGAQADLNTIRTRAGLGNTSASDKDSLLLAILHERQVELFSEWGHRWFDLKRVNNIDAIMKRITPQKGGVWNTNWQWYPIPLYDIRQNPELVQNTGY